MSLVITFDIAGLIEEHEHMADQIEEVLKHSIEQLATQTHAHILEQAQEKLHSTREQFTQALKLEETDGVWDISLDAKSAWMDEGIPAGFDMLPGFLSSPKAKTGKNGKYLVIPFKHSKPGEQKTPLQRALSLKVNFEMREKGLSPVKIDRKPDGSPKLGLLHKLDIKDPEISKAGKQKPWGLGSGAIKPKDVDIGPFLKNVRVYQNEIKKGPGGTSVKKDIMTFRTASEKQSGSKWIHPGTEKHSFFKEAEDWSNKQWEEVILPDIMQKLGLK